MRCPCTSPVGALSLATLTQLATSFTFIFPPTPQQQVLLVERSSVHRQLLVSKEHVTQRHDAAVTAVPRQGKVGGDMMMSTTNTEAGRSAIGAKESFLRNLERKIAGEDVPSSLLDSDLAILQSDSSLPADTNTSPSTTSVANVASWRGRWRICHAPHIETLGAVMLTRFPTVEYDFQSDDGRLVSHSRYESSIFGSGWFNADGRVVEVKDVSSSTTGKSEEKGETVKVIFERFWWDRNGEEKPTGAPPMAAGRQSDFVDWSVQAAGKAMFFDGLSVFPVRYLDDDLCIFEFKAAGTVVASQRVE